MSKVQRNVWKPTKMRWESHEEATTHEGATVAHLDRGSHVFIGDRYRLDYNDKDEYSITMEGADVMWLGNELYLYGFVEGGNYLNRTGQFRKELWIVIP